MAAWKSKLIVHSTWALTAAGAWWLGGRNTGADSPPAKSILAGHLLETRAAPAASATGSPGTGAAAAVAETGTWLKQWTGTAGAVSPERMAEAVQAALADTDSVRGLGRFTHLLGALTPENATAIADVLRGHPSTEAGPWMLMLASAWGAMDGQTALSALAMGEWQGNMQARETALAAWASVAPDLAKAWLKAQVADDPPPDSREAFSKDQMRALQASLVRGLAKNDPAAAVAYVAGLSDNRGDLAGVLALEQFRNGASAATRFAAEMPDESMRGAALEAVARRYMQVDAAAGAAWGAEIADDQDTRAAVGRVADRMAEKDVRAAFEWTLKLPPGPGQEEAFQQVFSEWARQDPGASSQELQRMTPGPERDNAIHSFSRILVSESPEDAIIWATAITDPTLRLDTQSDVVRRWNTTAPDAARTWAATNLPASARNQALQPPDD